MPQNDKKSNQTQRNDIVKDIFTRPKGEKEKVSAIFTHYKPSPKIISPGPQRETPSSPLKPLPVAIDIGTSSIKLFQLAEGEKGRLEIVAIDKEKLPAGAESAASVKSALKNIVSRNRTSPLCVTTLFTKDVQLYSMFFPPMAENELIAAIRYKVIQLKPFDSDVEKLIIRFSKWDGTGEISKTTHQRIIVACVTRDAVERRISLLQEAGLKPVKIGIAPFDLVNLSKLYKKTADLKDEVTLWVDFGAENTFLAIEKGGSLCFSRNLTLTSKHLTKALAQYRGIKEEEAEDLKKNYGLIFWSPDKKIPAFYEPPASPEKAQDKSETVYYGLISHVENLVVDIMHSFKYFSYQVARSQITKFNRIVLCAGGANLKNLDQFLSARLGAPVERINPFGLFRLSDLMQSRRKDLISASSDFAVCAGSAIGQRIKGPKQINLLPEERKKPIQVFASVMRQTPVMTAVLAVAIGTYLLSVQIGKAGYYKKEMNSLVKKVKTTKAQLGNMQAAQLTLNKEEAKLLNRKALLEARLSLVREGFRKPEDFSKRLASIAGLLPEDIWITDLNYKEAQLIISGSTPDIGLVSALIEDIKSSEEFIDANFNYTEKDPATEVYDFEIIAGVR